MWHSGAALKKHLSFMRVCFRGMFPSMLVSFNFVTCLLLRCLSLTFVAIVRLCYFKERLFLFFIFIFTTIFPPFFGKQSLDRISLDRNCHFSVDRNFTNHLIEFFDTFHLIESLNNEFGQTPKN
jgi:hypothetical protein